MIATLLALSVKLKIAISACNSHYNTCKLQHPQQKHMPIESNNSPEFTVCQKSSGIFPLYRWNRRSG